MLIRSGLVGMAVLGMVLAMTPGVVQSQGRAGGPAPSPAGRFVDNGDETITDTQLGLMWEKKTTTVGSGTSDTDIRDVDNTYTWEYAMNEWIDRTERSPDRVRERRRIRPTFRLEASHDARTEHARGGSGARTD